MPKNVRKKNNNLGGQARGAEGTRMQADAYNSHTLQRTFKNLVSPDSLNGAESLFNMEAVVAILKMAATDYSIQINLIICMV